MFCRTRFCRRIFLRLTFACFVAVLYIQIQLLPGSKKNDLVRAITFNYERIPPNIIQWDTICKLNANEKAKFRFPFGNKTLNTLMWYDVKGFTVNSLLRHPLFPWQPSEIGYSSEAFISHNISHYGQWLLGYLHVDISGDYMFALSSDDSSELWISVDDNPLKAQRVALVRGWTRYRQHNKYFYQISDPIRLRKCRKYFIEIIHKQSHGEGFVALSWKRPSYEKFYVITSTYLSPLTTNADLQGILSLDAINHGAFYYVFQRRRISKLSVDFDQFLPNQNIKLLTQNKSFSNLYCKKVLYKDTLNRHGNSMVAVYPGPYVSQHKESELNEVYEIPEKIAKEVVGNFLEILETRYPGTYSLSRIITVERKQFPNINERYLVDVVLRHSQDDVRATEYLFKKWSDESFCLLDLQWNPSLIHMIVTIEDRERPWALQFIDNLEYITKETKEENFHLTVIDLTKDSTVETLLRASSLRSKLEVIRRKGKISMFNVDNILEAITTIEGSSHVVMVIHPRLKLPIDIMSQARKHCVESSMAFSPLAFHLEQGYNPAEPRGSWDTSGFNLIAMYKRDWQKCLSTSMKTKTEEELQMSILNSIDVVRLRMNNLYFFT